MMLPILISVSLAPTSYFFWAWALVASIAAAANAASEIRRVEAASIVLSPSIVCFVVLEVSQAASVLASAAFVQLFPRRETALLPRGCDRSRSTSSKAARCACSIATPLIDILDEPLRPAAASSARGRLKSLHRPVEALGEAGGLIKSQHQVEVLHGGARGALAEIVEQCHQPRLLQLVGAEDVELHSVGAVQALRRQRRERSRLLETCDLDKALALIGLRQRRVQIPQLRRRGQCVKRQRHLDDHALRIAADRRLEDRRMLQAAMRLHLGDVLVTKRKSINAIGYLGEARGRLVLELLDHPAPAAGVSRDGIDRERPARRQHPGVRQRPHQADEAGRIAAGIGDAFCAFDRGALRPRHLGEAVGPAISRPVGRGGIDHTRPVVLDEADRLARGVIRQAENDHIGAVDDLLARRSLLPPRGIDRDELDITAARKPLQDLQSRRAGFAVDEDFRCHDGTLVALSGALIPGERELSHPVLQYYGVCRRGCAWRYRFGRETISIIWPSSPSGAWALALS